MKKYIFLALGLTGSLFAMERQQIPASALPPIKHAESTEKIVQPTQTEINDLFNAIQNQDLEKVTQLLNDSKNKKALANAKWKDMISLMRQAGERGNVKIIQALYDAGAIVDAPDSYNITPLMMAALQGHVDAVKWFTGHGAQVNAKDGSGQTASNYVSFGVAPQATKNEISKLLKDAGAQ